MTEEVIERLIQEHDGLPFEMKNDKLMIRWHLALADGILLARRTFILDGDDENSRIDYFDASYSDWDERDALYEWIMQDFIDCYAVDLYCGSAGELSVFTDFAGPDDEGLSQVLELFMKNYGEFLQDVFLNFGKWVEDYYTQLAPQAEAPRAPLTKEEIALNSETRLVRRVLDHCKVSALELAFEDDTIVMWRFTEARGKIWYLRMDLMYENCDDEEGTVMTYIEEYGSVDKSDPDNIGALHDVLLSLLLFDDSDRRKKVGDPFGLIGIDPEDLEDDD